MLRRVGGVVDEALQQKPVSLIGAADILASADLANAMSSLVQSAIYLSSAMSSASTSAICVCVGLSGRGGEK